MWWVKSIGADDRYCPDPSCVRSKIVLLDHISNDGALVENQTQFSALPKLSNNHYTTRAMEPRARNLTSVFHVQSGSINTILTGHINQNKLIVFNFSSVCLTNSEASLLVMRPHFCFSCVFC